MALQGERTILESSSDYVRGKEWKPTTKSFKLRPENTVSKYLVKTAIGLCLTGLLAYIGYRTVTSSSTAIGRWTDKITEQYVVEER